MPEVPKKPVPEEKIAILKKKEAPPAKGICHLFMLADILWIYNSQYFSDALLDRYFFLFFWRGLFIWNVCAAVFLVSFLFWIACGLFFNQNNVFEVTEVLKKPVPEKKVQVPKKEAPPAKGIWTYH